MPGLYFYRIFISHAWEYGADYYRLVNLLDAAPYFSYYNYSAPSEKPLELSSINASDAEIKRAITRKISNAQVVLVLGGMYSIYHHWMEYEVDEAVRMGKPIIVVKPWGQERVPNYLQARANDIVSWNTDSIVGAIRTLV